MPRPDVSSALRDWEIPVMLKTLTQETVDFVPTDVVTSSTILAVVQPVRAEDLRVETVDWSKAYIKLHTTSAIAVGQIVEYGGADYDVISVENWSAYGYYMAIAAATRQEVES